MPHKFKIAVSGCPRNCAEATIKDFGVICVDSGYELHVGGNGGIKLRGTDFLVQGRDRGGGAGLLRRLHPALPRGGALPRTHRAVGRARRARLCQGGGSSTTPPGVRALTAPVPLFAELHAGRSLGEARAAARTREAAPASRRNPSPRASAGAHRESPDRTDWLDIGPVDQIARRCGARTAAGARRRARSRSSAPRPAHLRAGQPLPAQGRAAERRASFTARR